MKRLMLVNSLFPGFRGRPKTNGVSGAPISMTMDECCLHEGGCYRSLTDQSSMAKNDTLSICFKTPGDEYFIFQKKYNWETFYAGKIEVIEGATWTPGTGAELNLYNRNRQYAESSKLLQDKSGSFVANQKLLINPTGITGGEIIDEDSTVIKKSTAFQTEEDKQPLKPNTTYIYKITAEAPANIAKFKLLWNEMRR